MVPAGSSVAEVSFAWAALLARYQGGGVAAVGFGTCNMHPVSVLGSVAAVCSCRCVCSVMTDPRVHCCSCVER